MSQKQFAIVVAVVTNEKGEVLMAKRHEPELPEAHNKWEFIGGGIDFGEDPIEALKREVREEAGVEVEVIRLLPKVVTNIWSFPNGNKEQVLIISYECKIISGTPTANLDQEIGDIKFCTIEEMKKLDSLPKTYEIVQLLPTNHQSLPIC
jgi:8-oxo-dGTP diphosphatase